MKVNERCLVNFYQQLKLIRNVPLMFGEKGENLNIYEKLSYSWSIKNIVSVRLNKALHCLCRLIKIIVKIE